MAASATVVEHEDELPLEVTTEIAIFGTVEASQQLILLAFGVQGRPVTSRPGLRA